MSKVLACDRYKNSSGPLDAAEVGEKTQITKIHPNPFLTVFGNLKTDANYNTFITYLFREISILSDSYE